MSAAIFVRTPRKRETLFMNVGEVGVEMQASILLVAISSQGD